MTNTSSMRILNIIKFIKHFSNILVRVCMLAKRYYLNTANFTNHRSQEHKYMASLVFGELKQSVYQ